MTGLVPVTVKPSFVGFEGIKHYRFKEGMTLLEIATEIDLTPEFWSGHGVICVGDRRVPQEYWGRVRPKVIDGREIAVTFNVVPYGNDRVTGVLVTLAGVAIAAAGFVFQQPWAVSIGIGVTLSGVGMLLAPPPPQGKDKAAQGQTLTAGIQGNALAPFEWLPRVVGHMVYSPPQLIRSYSVYANEKITIKGAVGLAGHHEVDAVRVNGALADSMDNFTYEVKEGASGDTALSIGNDWVWEESPRLRLASFDLDPDDSNRNRLLDQTTPTNSYPQYQTFLTRSGTPDKVVIRLLFPQGMSYDSSTNTEGAIPIRVEFRARGSSTWILGPEFHFYDENSGNMEMRRNIEFIWATSTSSAAVNSDYAGFVAYSHSGGSGSFQYDANSYFDNGGDDYCYHCVQEGDGFKVYLNPATFTPGPYEFRVKRGVAYRYSKFTASSFDYDGSPGNFFEHHTVALVDIISVPQYKLRGEVQIEAFQTWVDEYPLQAALDGDVPLTLIGFEAVNMEIQSIAAEFTSVVNTWSGSNWNTLEASSNPAAIYRHILLDSLNADPRDSSIVNSGVLEDWSEYCDDQGYECNAVVSDNEPEVLAMVASAGWAGPRSHEQWEVIIERSRASESITQNFTPLNSSNYRASKAFADLPHAFNVEYADENDDNNLKTIIVYAPGYNADGSGGNREASRFETIRMDGITDETKVEDRATGILRALYYRQVERQIDVGIEVLCSQRGDLVGLSHDLVDQNVWFGIVKSVTTSGGNVTGLVLSGKALLTGVTGPFSSVVRYMNQTIVTKPISNTTDTDTITFSTAFTIPSSNVLRKDCLVSIVVTSAGVRRQLISNIVHKDEFTATVSLMDVAPEIFTLSASLLESYGGQGLAIVAADDSMTIIN